MKTLSIITIGQILEDIEREGLALGENWKTPRLFVTRNEANQKNVARRLAKMREKDPNVTQEDVIKTFFFSTYRNRDNTWRIYKKEEAADLKQKIKERRGYA